MDTIPGDPAPRTRKISNYAHVTANNSWAVHLFSFLFEIFRKEKNLDEMPTNFRKNIQLGCRNTAIPGPAAPKYLKIKNLANYIAKKDYAWEFFVSLAEHLYFEEIDE